MKLHKAFAIVNSVINFLIVFFAIVSIAMQLTNVRNGVDIRHFTIWASISLLVSSAIMIAYELSRFMKYLSLPNPEEVDGSFFTYPKWIHFIRLISVTASIMAYVSVLVFIGPKFEGGVLSSLSGPLFFINFLNPSLVMISYAVFEYFEPINWKESIAGVSLPLVYGVVYVICAFITHVWDDFYILNTTSLTPMIIGFVFVLFVVSIGFPKVRKLFHTTVDFLTTKQDTTNLNTVDIYNITVFRSTFLISAIAGVSAAITFSVSKVLGYYQDVSHFVIVIFSIVCLSYLLIALLFIKRATNKDGSLKPHLLREGKYVLAVLIIFQWNIISYVFPSEDLWAYAPFFVILAVFFFDTKLIDFIEIGLIISITISWIINGDKLMPTPGDTFVPNLILRIVLLALSFVTLHLVCYFGGHFLIKGMENIFDYDTLTKLHTRRKMDIYLKDVFNKAKDNETEFCIGMIDLDDFKQVNDKFGHETGDEVLSRVSKIVLESINEHDLAFRYGGEEILVIFNQTAKQGYNLLLEMKEEIKKQEFVSGEEKFHVTISAGITNNVGFKHELEMIECADKQLYISKENGKDQVSSRNKFLDF